MTERYNYYRDFHFPKEYLIDYQPALDSLREKYEVKRFFKDDIIIFRVYSDEEIPAQLHLHDILGNGYLIETDNPLMDWYNEDKH